MEQSISMNKSKKKKQKHNALAVNKIAQTYGFTERYIRQILNGDRVGIMADNVLKDYRLLCAQLSQTLDNTITNLVNKQRNEKANQTI